MLEAFLYPCLVLSVCNFVEAGHLDYRCSLKNSKYRVVSPAPWAGAPVIPTGRLSVFYDLSPSLPCGGRLAEGGEGPGKHECFCTPKYMETDREHAGMST